MESKGVVTEQLVTPIMDSIMTDLHISSYNSSEEGSEEIRSRRNKIRRTRKSRRQRLLAYHQRLVKERGYPLSKLQLKQISASTTNHQPQFDGLHLCACVQQGALEIIGRPASWMQDARFFTSLLKMPDTENGRVEIARH